MKPETEETFSKCHGQVKTCSCEKHKNWKSIYKELPTDGAKCASRICGETGYCGDCIYDTKTATFRSYEEHRNRLVMTIWKHDEWYYV